MTHSNHSKTRNRKGGHHVSDGEALVPQPAFERRFRADVQEELDLLRYMARTSPRFYRSEDFQGEHVDKLTKLCDDFDEAWTQHLARHAWPLLPEAQQGTHVIHIGSELL